MSFCDKNLTVGVFDGIRSNLKNLSILLFNNHFEIFLGTTEELTLIKKNKVTGIFGELYDKYFVSKEIRRCKFVSAYDFKDSMSDDDIYRNISVEYLMKRNLIDFYSRPEGVNYLKDNQDFLEITNSISVHSVQVAQILNEPKSIASDFSEFLINNKLLIIMMFLGVIQLLITNFLLLNIIDLKKTKKLNSLKLFFTKSDQLKLISFKISIIFLCFNIFIFILITLLCNTIKTNKVIVPTEEILDSLSKLEETNKIPCFYSNESDLERVLTAPINSFLYRLFGEKVKNNQICVMPKTLAGYREMQKLFNKPVTEYYSFMDRLTNLVLFFYMSFLTVSSNNIAFKKETIYFEDVQVMYLRKNLEQAKKSFIIRRIDASFENGLYQNLFIRMEEAIMSNIKKNVKLFTTLDDYINAYTMVDDVKLKNYQTIFLLNFIVLIILLFIFLMNLFLNNYRLNISSNFFKTIKIKNF